MYCETHDPPNPGQPASGYRARLHSAARWSAERLAASLQNLRARRAADYFGVLMYHRVAELVPGAEPPTWNVTPKRLRQQLAGLLARGFEAWPLSKLIDACRRRCAIPPSVFAVTFDDGYENNYVHAWPILRELNVPATIFLATKYLDTDRPFPFDDWRAFGSSRSSPSAWRPLSTSQCREMLSGGLIELGAHTHSHQRFLGRPDDFRRDLTLCLDVLRERFGIERPAFAFPFGDFNQELITAAKQLGVSCCLSTCRRPVRLDEDMCHWGRFDVEESDSPAVLAAKLSGWYSTVTTAGKAFITPLRLSSRGDKPTSVPPQKACVSKDVAS